MTILTFTAVLGLASFGAGLIGALTGLGGGVVIVPLLVIAFGVDIRYAIGASLVSVIATSSGAAAAYVREGYLISTRHAPEIATTVGPVRRDAGDAHPGKRTRLVFRLCCCIPRNCLATNTSETAGVAAPDG